MSTPGVRVDAPSFTPGAGVAKVTPSAVGADAAHSVSKLAPVARPFVPAGPPAAQASSGDGPKAKAHVSATAPAASAATSTNSRPDPPARSGLGVAAPAFRPGSTQSDAVKAGPVTPTGSSTRNAASSTTPPMMTAAPFRPGAPHASKPDAGRSSSAHSSTPPSSLPASAHSPTHSLASKAPGAPHRGAGPAGGGGAAANAAGGAKGNHSHPPSFAPPPRSSTSSPAPHTPTHQAYPPPAPHAAWGPPPSAQGFAGGPYSGGPAYGMAPAGMMAGQNAHMGDPMTNFAVWSGAAGQGGLGGRPWAASGGQPGGFGQARVGKGLYVKSDGVGALAGQFMSGMLRQQLMEAAYAVQSQWPTVKAADSSDGVGLLPERLGPYHSLYPLEEMEGVTPGSTGPEAISQALGVRSAVLKGVSKMDGLAYTLRRIDPSQTSPSAELMASARHAVDAWSSVAAHPHLVGLRAAFVSAELHRTPALVFCHDFHPGSKTLAGLHLTPTATHSGMLGLDAPPEQLLWSYLVQLTSALRAVHAAGLALKPACLHPTKVLVSPQGRVRVGCCGVIDSLTGDVACEREGLHQAQRGDLTSLGQLVVTLGCAGLVPPGHPGSLDIMASAAHPSAPGMPRFSPELTRLVAALLGAARGGSLGTVRQLVAAVAEHSLSEMEAGAASADNLMSELSLECENGRLLRLLVKLGFINERPEGDMAGSWAETGNPYLLKLFRDFVFHQVAPQAHPAAGGPLLDWGHVVETLNKLDAGTPEKILLLARDESAMLVSSYADLKRCVEGAYNELQQAATTAVARNKAAGPGSAGSVTTSL